MKPSYPDIVELGDAAGIGPEWFDEHGVPRFRPFHPSLLGVYDTFAVLARVRCQEARCRRQMLVGVGWDRIDLRAVLAGKQPDDCVRSLGRLASGFDYGDPPRHDCPGAGETMGSDLDRLLEVWERPDLDWCRRSRLEGWHVARHQETRT